MSNFVSGDDKVWSRRRFLFAAGVAALAPRPARAAVRPQRIVLGDGKHRYRWIKDWAKLPDGMSFGNTHGCIVIDSKRRLYMNTDTENAVIVFDHNGKFLKAWGNTFKDGLHGMCIVKEKGKEVMYLAHIGRHEVVKTTLDGDVLMTLPFPEQAGVYSKPEQYKPTSVAVAPRGDVYVGDGYGLSWVHQYRPDGEYVRSWGGKGKEPGKLHTPHGLWVDTRRKPATLLVADRGNSRIQIYDLDGNLQGSISGNFKSPCHLHQRGQDLVVPDLQGRVTIVDKNNNLVTHLGENPDSELRGKNPIEPDRWKDGEFIAPHCARWDNQGNLYVLDWNKFGRLTKLQRIA
jgi:hypothetical protein